MPKTTITREGLVSRMLKGGLKTALPLLALFIGVSSYMALKANKPNPPKHIKREIVQPVRTQKIILASHQPGLALYGEIKTGRKVDLRALVAGKVLKTGAHFREGALVKKGELLLSIDPFKYQGAVIEAGAKIKEAQAKLKEVNAQIKSETESIKYALEQFKLSKRDFDRAKKLVVRGSVTRQGAEAREIIVSQRRQTLDGKRSNLEILQARHEQALASIETLKWRLREAERNLRDTNLKAPFDGYIGTLNANVGKLLNVNDQVAQLLDSNWMDVVFTLSDRQYGRLLSASGTKRNQATGPTKTAKNGLLGRVVKLSWQLGATTLGYEAVIERIGAQISSETGGVSIYAKLKDPSSPRPVRAGAFVDVLVPDRVYQNVARLPQTSLYGRTKVYVVGPEKRLQERRVTLHAIDGEHVLVSGELADQEPVVTTRMSTIGAGMKVRNLGSSSAPEKRSKKDRSVSKALELEKNHWKQTSGKKRHEGGDTSKPRAKRQQGDRSMTRKEHNNRG